MADTRLARAEIEAALRVLESGNLRQGEQCECFEKALSQALGPRHAVTCANGTAALHLAWMALLEPGDEVLVPAFTFIATASTVNACGARPVFCDVDPETFLIDLDDAARRVTGRTRAIAPVHLFGNAVATDEVAAFAGRHGLAVVWDAAQAHGCEYRGGPVGELGDVVTWSFYPSKNLFTGEGGLVGTPDEGLANSVRRLRSHGTEGRYRHVTLGLNYRMTDVEAAIGLAQLARFERMLERRRSNAQALSAMLDGVDGVRLQRTTAGARHAWHQFCVLIEPDVYGRDRDELARALAERGIASAVHYPTGLHDQPVYRELYGRQSLPVTERLCERILALPVHHGLEHADVERIGAAVRALAR